MPKKRPIRYLTPVKRAKGRVIYKWEPSKSLRDAGFATVMFDENYLAAAAKAEALNAELDAWRLGVPPSPSPLTGEGWGEGARFMPPKNLFHSTWADLDRNYRHDTDMGLPSKKPKTQKEYSSRMKWLMRWAEGGKTRLANIDDDMARDLRNQLVRSKSAFMASSVLRVFSLLMSYAEYNKMIVKGSDPAKRMKVPTPPRRRKRIALETVDFLVDSAADVALARVALAIEIGFYTLQRPGDLRTATPMHWRRMNDLDATDRAALCGPDGHVYGFRFQQAKTRAWIGNAVHHALRLKVEARIADMNNAGAAYILFHDGAGKGAGGQWHEREFNRDFRAVVDHAIILATEKGDQWLVDQLTGLQFRDIRRSGMGWHKDMGASKEQIASRSGHSIKEVEDILETYMPADERGSAAAFARAFTASQDRKQERMGG